MGQFQFQFLTGGGLLKLPVPVPQGSGTLRIGDPRHPCIWRMLGRKEGKGGAGFRKGSFVRQSIRAPTGSPENSFGKSVISSWRSRARAHVSRFVRRSRPFRAAWGILVARQDDGVSSTRDSGIVQFNSSGPFCETSAPFPRRSSPSPCFSPCLQVCDRK